MLKLSRLALVAALAISFAACDSADPTPPPPPPPPPSTTGTITGTISLPPGTNGSAGNARVAIYQSFDDWNNDRFAYQTAADANGAYTIANIVPGTYYMDAWKDNDNSGTITAADFYGVYGSFSAGGANLTPIPVAAGQSPNVTFTITLAGGPFGPTKIISAAN